MGKGGEGGEGGEGGLTFLFEPLLRFALISATSASTSALSGLQGLPHAALQLFFHPAPQPFLHHATELGMANAPYKFFFAWLRLHQRPPKQFFLVNTEKMPQRLAKNPMVTNTLTTRVSELSKKIKADAQAKSTTARSKNSNIKSKSKNNKGATTGKRKQPEEEEEEDWKFDLQLTVRFETQTDMIQDIFKQLVKDCDNFEEQKKPPIEVMGFTTSWNDIGETKEVDGNTAQFHPAEFTVKAWTDEKEEMTALKKILAKTLKQYKGLSNVHLIIPRKNNYVVADIEDKEYIQECKRRRKAQAEEESDDDDDSDDDDSDEDDSGSGSDSGSDSEEEE